jgi:hypothetical protein
MLGSHRQPCGGGDVMIHATSPRRSLPFQSKLLVITVAPSSESITRLNTHSLKLSFLVSALNLVFLAAIESPDRALSIPTNCVFHDLVVVEYAVAESIVDSRQIVHFCRLGVDYLTF